MFIALFGHILFTSTFVVPLTIQRGGYRFSLGAVMPLQLFSVVGPDAPAGAGVLVDIIREDRREADARRGTVRIARGEVVVAVGGVLVGAARVLRPVGAEAVVVRNASLEEVVVEV